jgi:hypothetical protein
LLPIVPPCTKRSGLVGSGRMLADYQYPITQREALTGTAEGCYMAGVDDRAFETRVSLRGVLYT